MKKIGVLGSGAVGKVLADGFVKHGYEVMLGSREPARLAAWQAAAGSRGLAGTFADAARFGDVVVLAVKGTAAEEVVRLIGSDTLSGKTVIDATNVQPEARKPLVALALVHRRQERQHPLARGGPGGELLPLAVVEGSDDAVVRRVDVVEGVENLEEAGVEVAGHGQPDLSLLDEGKELAHAGRCEGRAGLGARGLVDHPGLAGGEAGAGRSLAPADSRTEALDALLALPEMELPLVSPDGRWVAWSWYKVGPAADVFVAPTDGSAAPVRAPTTSRSRRCRSAACRCSTRRAPTPMP